MKTGTYILFFVSFLLFCNSNAQVGIGTINPQSETLLDVDSSDKGLLLTRISIDNFDTFNLPVGSQTESLLLYNTNITSGKGFTFWEGSKWRHLNNRFFWSTYGDEDVVASNYLGTRDATSFLIGTSSVPRLEISNNGRLSNYNLGSNSFPAWALVDSGDGFSTLGNELRWNISGSSHLAISDNEILFNESQNDTDLILNTAAGQFLKIDAAQNRIGILASGPIESTVHVQGAASRVRVESLNSSNSNNNGVDKSLLLVDSNGEFKLESTPYLTKLPQFNFENSFLDSAVTIRNATLGQQAQVIFTTTETLTENALLQVVYQSSISLRNNNGNFFDDGRPRKYGLRVLVNGRTIAQTSKMFTCNDSNGSVAGGLMYLNGKGYIPLTGVTTGTTYTIQVEAFVDGGNNSTAIIYGAGSNDFFEVAVHY